jgi:hypothetical protein
MCVLLLSCFCRKLAYRPHSVQSGALVSPVHGHTSFSMMFPSRGLSGPPCGTPSGLSSNIPPTMTPARRNLWISEITRPSFIVSDSIWMSLLWFTVSKYFSKIHIDYPSVALGDVGLALSERIMGTSFRSESKAVV